MAHPMDDLERMEDAWDRMSADYGDRLGLAPDDAHYRALAGQIPISESPIRILDIGCGLGFELDGILPKVSAARVVCMDISQKMLTRLEKRLSSRGPEIKTLHGSYVDADLGVAEFDIVISSLTVHHLPRPTKFGLFRKILTALTPRGLYVELDDVTDSERERVGQQWYEEFVAHREGGECGEWNHNMSFTIANEKALLEEAGFPLVTVPWTRTDADGNGRAIFVARKWAEPSVPGDA